jgi:cytoskeletal protein CcmA (bactofilin family)
MNVFSRRRDEKSGAPGSEPQPATVPTARDPDLGAPPPRFSTRDTQDMSLAPKPGNAPTMPAGPTPPSGTAIPPRPAQMGGLGAPSAPSTPVSIGPAPRSSADRRTLVVGRGISLQGTVSEAERLVVEGMVESQMIQASELSISETGVFKGEVQVEDAEIAGIFDGTITARGALVIRGTGRVIGVARCRKLMVEEGGQISGRMEMLGDQSSNSTLSIPAPQPVPAEA